MSFAYLPLYTGDYLRKTRALTPVSHGLYLLLLIHCWDSGEPLPGDFAEIANIAGARTESECAAVEKIVRKYFHQNADGTWFNRRIEKELDRSNAIAAERSAAGARGAAARWAAKANGKQTHGKRMAIDAPQPQPYPHVVQKPTPVVDEGSGEKTRKPNGRPASLATRLPPGWQAPDEWIELGMRLHPDWTRQGVVRESISFRDYWTAKAGKDATKMDWLATWRTWIRRADTEPKR